MKLIEKLNKTGKTFKPNSGAFFTVGFLSIDDDWDSLLIPLEVTRGANMPVRKPKYLKIWLEIFEIPNKRRNIVE